MCRLSLVALFSAWLIVTLSGCSPQQQQDLQSQVTAALSRVTIGNTGGEGAYLRRTPHDADKLKAWPDGTVLIVVAEDVQSEGHTWKHVRDPDGNVGYVPAEYTLFMGVSTDEAQRLASQAATKAQQDGWPEKIAGALSQLLGSVQTRTSAPGNVSRQAGPNGARPIWMLDSSKS
jgi:hypothetical protein